MKINFIHPLLAKWLPIYKRIRAAIEGEDAIKLLGVEVLPMPNAYDQSKANVCRYTNYLFRAVWYAATGRTLQGLVGFVFSKDPMLKLPETLADMEHDVDGRGVTLVQQSKQALNRVLSLGRCGLLVDYPTVSQPLTQEDVSTQRILPTVCFYEPENIINWHEKKVGTRMVVDMLVLREVVEVQKDDGYSFDYETRYRALRLTAEGVTGVVVVEGKQDATSKEVELTLIESYSVIDKTGAPFKQIPFIFLGSENNDPVIDTPPLNDMVTLNCAHFRNSADYEEACFIMGQPTPYVTGVTQQWLADVLKGEIQLGSRVFIPLPQGAMAGLLQVAPNTMPKEAMELKEKQMVALGAKLVQNLEVQQTATQATMDYTSEVSSLVAAANNVFLGYKIAFQYAGLFVGTGTIEFEFELAESLNLKSITPEQAQGLITLFQEGLLSFEETRWSLSKAGVAWQEDAAVLAEGEKRKQEAADRELTQAKELAKAKPVPVGKEKKVA